jgi:hypothetical protein
VSVRLRWAVIAMTLALAALAALLTMPFTVVADLIGPH